MKKQAWAAVGAGLVAVALLWLGNNPDMIAYPCDDAVNWWCYILGICGC